MEVLKTYDETCTIGEISPKGFGKRRPKLYRFDKKLLKKLLSHINGDFIEIGISDYDMKNSQIYDKHRCGLLVIKDNKKKYHALAGIILPIDDLKWSD